MDLIPGEYRRALKLKRLIRLFMVASLAVVAVIGLAWISLNHLVSSGKAQVAVLQQQKTLAETDKAQAATLQQKKLVIEEQLKALAGLRNGKQVSHFLHAVDTAYVDGIWFDSVQFLRGAANSSSPGALRAAGIVVVPNTAPGTPPVDFSQRVDIIGHALNHSLLAEFMRRLGGQAGVADLRLVDTKQRAYLTTQVVDFTLSLQLAGKTEGQP